MRLKRFFCLVSLFGLSTMLCACGGGELDEFGCDSDSDCKHGRVCINGTCQYSGGSCNEDADCPSGQHCYQGNCLVCDGDADGYFNARCAGSDCNDSNGSIHPGAKELCGDGLDNDCDGVTDPAELCEGKCAGVECPEGYACDPETGECIPICTPQCTGKECGPDGCGKSCGRCPTGTYCNRFGICEEGCEDRCKAEGETACLGNGVITCEDTNGDGCLEWSQPVDCASGEHCVDGECGPCTPDCEGKECGSDGCGGSCGECPPGTYCENFTCQPGCRDDCEWNETRCADQYSYYPCGNYDDDECLDWGPRQRCPGGTLCDEATGSCTGGCTDECFWGERQCWDEFSYVECFDYDGDGCSEFGPPVACPSGEYCDPETGYCSGGCVDECYWGESYCFDEISVVECGEFDGDPCTEFGPPMMCPEGSYCDPDTGRCAGSCYDDCDPNDFICLSVREYLTCGQYDDDECLDWSEPRRCPRRTRCSEEEHECVPVGCEDECPEGMRECWDEWTYVECGQYDNDPCTEWSPPRSCPEGTICDWQSGQCIPHQDCQLDAYEPDDYMVNATPLYPFEPQAHSLCPQGDHDWWSFNLQEAAQVTLETFGEYGDTVMWLYTDDGDEIGFDDDAGQDLFSRIVIDLPAGSYRVQVQEFSDYGIIETYYINLSTETACIPDCTGRECGPDPVCGMSCGSCDAGWYCTPEGQCIYDGHREGAGDPCGFYTACPADWNAAYTCVEHPGGFDGFCSYPCQSQDDCAVDFPEGCCRELAEGYSVCLVGDLCNVQHPGYLNECGFECMPDMFCIEDIGGGPESYCIFTCDLAMGACPLGGTCLDPGEDGATGFCLPQGDGEFGDPCSLMDGCQSGLMCLPISEDHPGYCNRMCSNLFPCPGPFQCILPDGQGGQWCALPCYSPSDCSVLGDWTCVTFDGNMGVCLPN